MEDNWGKIHNYFIRWKYLLMLKKATGGGGGVVPIENNMIFQQNKKHVHIIILFKSLHPLARNALCCLLEHQ